ncbi:MAG: hypothetical protein MJ249_16390, partial [Kiritimatiellae bacterium]|nr:hypothetical protein [Kiritimatiellia bacterium]
MVAEEAPVARRSSVLFISLSIRSFHNFLYDTTTASTFLGKMPYIISNFIQRDEPIFYLPERSIHPKSYFLNLVKQENAPPAPMMQARASERVRS